MVHEYESELSKESNSRSWCPNSHLLKRRLPCFWNESAGEQDTDEGDYAVAPEGAVKSEQLVEVDKRLDSEESTEVAESRGERGAMGPELQGK